MNFIKKAQELARGADRPRENAVQTGAFGYGHLVLVKNASVLAFVLGVCVGLSLVMLVAARAVD
jgi:hypothetical protein